MQDILEEEDLVGRMHGNTDKKNTKWVVMTTIQRPTEALQSLAKNNPTWQIVVVGDKKTPASWK